MRVGLISYPMLFQRRGGLQVQIIETMAALNAAGVEASYVDPYREKLSDFDIVHVFGAVAGNQNIVAEARNQKVPVVLSGVLQLLPRRRAIRYDLISRLVGRLTGWELTTSYSRIAAAVDAASHVVALGARERTTVVDAYAKPEHAVSVVPNGIGERFFTASAAAFGERYPAEGGKTVLMVASISDWKNQLALCKAVATLDVVSRLYLIGDCGASARPYLEQCLGAAGGKALFLGPFDYHDPLLASAYAFADVFALPSRGEVMPISVLEALAAGTPVVVTSRHCHDIKPAPAMLQEVSPENVDEIRSALLRCLAKTPDRAEVRKMVEDFRWPLVAEKLIAMYRSILGEPGFRPDIDRKQGGFSGLK